MKQYEYTTSWMKQVCSWAYIRTPSVYYLNYCFEFRACVLVLHRRWQIRNDAQRRFYDPAVNIIPTTVARQTDRERVDCEVVVAGCCEGKIQAKPIFTTTKNAVFQRKGETETDEGLPQMYIPQILDARVTRHFTVDIGYTGNL